MIYKTILFGIGTLLSISMSSVWAQDAEYCEGKYDTASLRQCAMADYKLEEHKINRVYKELMATLSSKDKQRLKAAQLAWIDFRIKDCDFQTGWETGTIGPLMSMSCETTHTEERRKTLEERLESERK